MLLSIILPVKQFVNIVIVETGLIETDLTIHFNRDAMFYDTNNGQVRTIFKLGCVWSNRLKELTTFYGF